MKDLIPAQYDWKIALKKVAYTALKVLVAGVIYNNMEGRMASEVSVSAAAALEVVHDWAKLRFSDAHWL